MNFKKLISLASAAAMLAAFSGGGGTALAAEVNPGVTGSYSIDFEAKTGTYSWDFSGASDASASTTYDAGNGLEITLNGNGALYKTDDEATYNGIYGLDNWGMTDSGDSATQYIKFTAPATGTLYFTAYFNSYSSKHRVYYSTSGIPSKSSDKLYGYGTDNSNVQIAETKDLSLSVTQGTTYYISVYRGVTSKNAHTYLYDFKFVVTNNAVKVDDSNTYTDATNYPNYKGFYAKDVSLSGDGNHTINWYISSGNSSWLKNTEAQTINYSGEGTVSFGLALQDENASSYTAAYTID